MNRRFNQKILFVLFIIIFFSCENNITNPSDNNSPAFIVFTPNESTPMMYISIDFDRKSIGITIIDTIIAQPPSSMNVTFTTLSGDIEEYSLGVLLATFNGDYFGYGGGIPFILTENAPSIHSKVLELNSIIEKITVSYKSYNDSQQKDYSIVISNSIPFYPRRWFDRLP